MSGGDCEPPIRLNQRPTAISTFKDGGNSPTRGGDCEPPIRLNQKSMTENSGVALVLLCQVCDIKKVMDISFF